MLKALAVMGALAFSVTASADGVPCSIQPEKNSSASELPALAKVSQAEARSTALASLQTSAPAAVAAGELEVEHGCLVYSFDIRITGASGVEEVVIDAGTGQVLSRKHESPKQEAAENARERASSGKAH